MCAWCHVMGACMCVLYLCNFVACVFIEVYRLDQYTVLCYMVVSWNGGTPKYPQIIHFNRTGFSIINYKPPIFGYPHWWNPPMFCHVYAIHNDYRLFSTCTWCSEASHTKTKTHGSVMTFQCFSHAFNMMVSELHGQVFATFIVCIFVCVPFNSLTTCLVLQTHTGVYRKETRVFFFLQLLRGRVISNC